MNISDTNFDRIEAYLFDRLSPEDKQAFERDMQENPELARAVQVHQTEHRAMELLLRQEMQDNLAAWKQEKETQAVETATGAKKVSMGANRRLWFRLAAAASVLLVIGFFSRNLFTGTDNAGLASAYFEESAAGVRSGGGNDAPAELAPMLERMADKDYQGALAAAPASSDADIREKTALLKGECYFYLQDFPNAIATFNSLLAAGASPAGREQAEWLLLLTYIAEGKHTQESEALFERILQDAGHGYWKQAKELKGKVK